jgi:hypothetical protein
LRQVLEGPLAQLSSQVERLFEEAHGRAKRELAEQINQAARRIGQAATREELGATLVDAAGAFAAAAALVRVEGQAARGDCIRGVSEETARAFAALEIPLASAPALAAAVESRDPVTALAAPAEVSAELAALVGQAAEERIQIFPLVAQEKVPALVCAWGNVLGAALELLVQVAAGWIAPARDGATKELVEIASAPAAPVEAEGTAKAEDPSEAGLSDEEERAHLCARRFARVRVAEMRLQEAPAVQGGRAGRDLYAALRPQIDAAREAFRESFHAAWPGMTDYLHAELVRTLAHDDPELLGKNYPGPMA